MLEEGFPERYLVAAEIASARMDQKGHCYLELIEQDDKGIIAQMRATIWAYQYRIISSRFTKATGMQLSKGIRVLLGIEVSFHERYGLSLNVIDVDPAYTLGEMALRRREILARLQKEGLLERNRALEVPLLPLRVAVISSPHAAGYGDFIQHLRENPYGYRVETVLFESVMQGERAENSIVASLGECRGRAEAFDLVVIIRGGGGEADLQCFDSFAIGKAIAVMPLPVISGIGHERDRTVVDEVSHTAVKTPTAAAEFVVRRIREFHLRVLDLESRLVAAQREFASAFNAGLYRLSRDLERGVARFLAGEQGRVARNSVSLGRARRILVSGLTHLESLRERSLRASRQVTRRHQAAAGHAGVLLRSTVRSFCRHQQHRLDALGDVVRHLAPENILKRGFSITYRGDGVLLKSAKNVGEGDIIETVLLSGRIASRVTGTEADGGE